MTVLQVCAFAAPNAGNFIASLTHLEKCLKEKGIDTIYAFSDGAQGKPWCREIQQRTKVYFLPTAKARILPKTYQIFRRIYRENDISIMHSHFELYDMPATVTAPKKTKIFWHLHDALRLNYEKSGSGRKLLYRIQYGLLGSRSQLLTVSREHGEFAAELGFSRKRILYFPNGINTLRIRPTGLNKHSRRFLMFGWEVRRKGVDLVVEAARRMNRSDCSIVVVGHEKCREYLDGVQAPDVIAYHLPVENINDLYADTRVFLHLSRAEGLSYALLEAIYAGLPVICSDIPENRFAAEFRNVFMVPNEDVVAITRQMERLLLWDGHVAEQDVQENRRLIEAQYSMNAWARNLIERYLE